MANILLVLEEADPAMQHHWVDRLDAGLDDCEPADACEVLHGLIDRAADLLAALEGLLRNACRPGDDGKYDDLFDDARKAARAAVAKARGG